MNKKIKMVSGLSVSSELKLDKGVEKLSLLRKFLNIIICYRIESVIEVQTLRYKSDGDGLQL